jgi:hypothetical protein
MVVKFYYNGKGIFTKSEIIHTRTTGIIDEIKGLLQSR